jgi:hypothetical protein
MYTCPEDMKEIRLIGKVEKDKLDAEVSLI